ncbi:MAG: ATP synthase subunit I [Oscillospiraceae bacterium]
MRTIKNETRSNFINITITLGILNLTIILIALLSNFFSVSIVLGLFLGDIVSLFNFLALTISAYKAVQKSDLLARRYMLKSYVIRYFVFGLIFILVIKCKIICSWAFFIPMLGPKLYFVLIYNIINRKGER